jgi:hypothetical protein
MRILFLEIYETGLSHAGSVALSKHVIHYVPCLGFPYYNLTTPNKRAATQGHSEQLCEFKPVQW